MDNTDRTETGGGEGVSVAEKRPTRRTRGWAQRKRERGDPTREDFRACLRQRAAKL